MQPAKDIVQMMPVLDHQLQSANSLSVDKLSHIRSHSVDNISLSQMHKLFVMQQLRSRKILNNVSMNNQLFKPGFTPDDVGVIDILFAPVMGDGAAPL